MRSRMWCVTGVAALLCGVDFGVGIGASGAAADGGGRPALAYRAVILKSRIYGQSQAYGACSRFWVGAALPRGHKSLSHAVLCRAGAGRIVGLPLPGPGGWAAMGTDGRSVVGCGDRGGAVLWSGNPLRATVLAPAGSSLSVAFSVFGKCEVGLVQMGGSVAIHAVLWRGGAGGLVDLNPPGFDFSVARGVYGREEVGWGFRGRGKPHALTWHGTAASAMDINPRGFEESKAYGIWGRRVVGYGVKRAGAKHALLWTGPSRKVVDLNPPGYAQSVCYAISGAREVGMAIRRGGRVWHAMVWFGSAASAVDLQHAFAGPAFGSEACAVAPNGNIFGFTADLKIKRDFAVEWVPVGQGGRALRKDGASPAKQAQPEVAVAPSPTTHK